MHISKGFVQLRENMTSNELVWIRAVIFCQILCCVRTMIATVDRQIPWKNAHPRQGALGVAPCIIARTRGLGA